MIEVIETNVRLGKSGNSIWIEGGKLSRHQWAKGDSAQIRKESGTIKLSKKMTPEKRSSRTIQNISGRLHRSRSETKPILELQLKKIDVPWDEGTPILVTVTNISITIEINDHLEKRKERLIKLNDTQNGNGHTIALLDSFNTPEEPHKPITPSCSLAEIYFDLLANKNDSAMFFNFLFSIETVNPFAVLIHDYESYHNTIGDGFGSVLESLGYILHTTKCGEILAIDNSIKPELYGLSTKSIADMFKLKSFARIEASYGNPYGNQQDRVKELHKGLFENSVSTCSIFHGGGTFEFGNRQAFSKHGLSQKLNLVSEINDDYLSHSFDVNRESFYEKTKILSGNMLNHNQFKYITPSILLTAGIVCIHPDVIFNDIPYKNLIHQSDKVIFMITH